MAFQCQTPDCEAHLKGWNYPAPMPCAKCQAPVVEVSAFLARSEFEQRVLDGYPYVIALPFLKMLDDQSYRIRLDWLVATLENILKYMGLLVLGEYHAKENLRLPRLNDRFKQNLYRPSLGSWNEFLRESIKELDKAGHSWVLPEVHEGYEAIEKKGKVYSVPQETTDENDQKTVRIIKGTAIGTLINFRNRELGHGHVLDEAKSKDLYLQFRPILDDLLKGVAFSELLTLVSADRTGLYRLTGCRSKQILGRMPNQEELGRMWVEHEDGRSLEIRPFFILPGEVAGANSDSIVLVYEQFTGGRRVVFRCPRSGDVESSGKPLRTLKEKIQHKEEEKPFAGSEMTEQLFRDRLVDWNARVMEGLIREKKVIPGVYQSREDAENVLRGWTSARESLLVIAAEAGSGKTNLLAEMTRQYAESDFPVTLIRAIHLKTLDFKMALGRVLNLEPDWQFKELIWLGRNRHKPWMILVDGVNEHAKSKALFRNIQSFLSDAPEQSVKVVLSWRVRSTQDLPDLVDIDESGGRLGRVYVDREGLRKEVESFCWPLHFIDFETIAPALPFFKGYRPYEGFPFQFSHHILHRDGRVEHANEYLGLGQGEDPTFELIRQLHAALSENDGSVFMYSQHENTYLRYARSRLLNNSPYPEAETRTLVQFIESIAAPSRWEPDAWSAGDRQLIDLAGIVRRRFWHANMGGSNSIKKVLPAVMESSPYLQQEYGTARYGSSEMRSLNFQPTVWFQRDSEGHVVDPYALLKDIQLHQWGGRLDEIETVYDDEVILNGGAAMTAWACMQFAEMSDTERNALDGKLRQYCELDTLAMVMIVQYFLEESRHQNP